MKFDNSTVMQFSPFDEVGYCAPDWLHMNLPESLPMVWRRLVKSYYLTVLLMLEKRPPHQIGLLIEAENGRLKFHLVPCASCGKSEELGALRLVGYHYTQLSKQIWRRKLSEMQMEAK